jgi:ribulose-phosphate 3-epimerase
MTSSKKLIAPSILSADFGRLAEEVIAVEAAGADVIHVDVMDGHFVPNITIGPMVVAAIKKATVLPLDVHLMIENPQDFVPDFIKAGADWVSVHAEEGYHLDRTIRLIKDLGAKAGVVLNPATPLSVLDHLLTTADFVLLMTVNPGFGGQDFIPYGLDKIRALRCLIDEARSNAFIEVDGGVKTANVGEIAACGADVFVAGSAIFQSPDYKKTIQQMKKAIAVRP